MLATGAQRTRTVSHEPCASQPTGTIDRRSAQRALTEDATLELALAAHGVPTPQIRKLVRLAAAQPDDARAAALGQSVERFTAENLAARLLHAR